MLVKSASSRVLAVPLPEDAKLFDWPRNVAPHLNEMVLLCPTPFILIVPLVGAVAGAASTAGTAGEPGEPGVKNFVG